MSRLQKKCMMASAATHGFLLLLLVVGSAFFVPQPEPPKKITPMEVIPSELVDAALNPGGGIPQPEVTQPEPQKQPAPQPEVKKPEPKPEVKKPEVKKPEPKPEVKKPEPKPEVKKPEPPKKEEPLKLTRATPDDLKKRAPKRAPEPKGPDLSKVLKDSANNLAKAYAGTSTLKMVGPGDGNAGNYDSFVYQTYKNAWRVPQGLNDDTVSTEIEVVISRSGSVIKKRIMRRSGNSLLDRSIEELIERVKFIAPFPKETKDQQRTYQIEFNLRLKAIG